MSLEDEKKFSKPPPPPITLPLQEVGESPRESVIAWLEEAVPTPDTSLPSARDWNDSQLYHRNFLRAGIIDLLYTGKGIARDFNGSEIKRAYGTAGDDPRATSAIQSRLHLEIFRQLAEALLLRDESSKTQENEIVSKERYLYFNKLTNNTKTPDDYWFHSYREEQKQKIPGQKKPVNYNDEYYPGTKETNDALTRAPTRGELLLPLAYAIYRGDEENEEAGIQAGDNMGVIREVLFPFIGTDPEDLQTQLDSTLQAMTNLSSDIVVTVVVPSINKTEAAASTVMSEWQDRLIASIRYPGMQLRYVTLPIFQDEIEFFTDRYAKPREETPPEPVRIEEEKTEPIPSLIEQAFSYFRSIEAFAQAKDPEQVWRYIKFLAGEKSVAVLLADEILTDAEEGITKVVGEPVILAVAEDINESLMGQIGRGNAKVYNAIEAKPEDRAIMLRTLSVGGDILKNVYVLDTRNNPDDITEDDYFDQVREAISLATGLSEDILREIEADMRDLRTRGKDVALYKSNPQTILSIIGTDELHKEYTTILQDELSRVMPSSLHSETIPGVNQIEEEESQMDDELVNFFKYNIPLTLINGATPKELQNSILPNMKAWLIASQKESEQINRIRAREIVRQLKEKVPSSAGKDLFLDVHIWNEEVKGLPQAVRALIREDAPELAIHVSSIGEYSPYHPSYIESLQDELSRRYQPETLERYKEKLEALASDATEEANIASALLSIANDAEQLRSLQSGNSITISETEQLSTDQADALLFGLVLDEKAVKKSFLSEAIEHAYKVAGEQTPGRDYDQERLYVRLVLDTLDNVELTTLFAPPELLSTLSKKAKTNADDLQRKVKSEKTTKGRNIAQANADQARNELVKIAQRIQKGYDRAENNPTYNILSTLRKLITREHPRPAEYSGGENAIRYKIAVDKANKGNNPPPNPKHYIESSAYYPIALYLDNQLKNSLQALESILDPKIKKVQQTQMIDKSLVSKNNNTETRNGGEKVIYSSAQDNRGPNIRKSRK